MSFTGSLTTIVVGEKANEFLGTLAGHHSKTVLTRVLAEAGRGLVLDDKRKVIRPDSPRFFVDATPSHERALTVRETLEFVFETSWGSKDAKALSSWLSSRAFVEELASSLGLRHVLETRIFFLSTVQSRCASLGEALLTAAAYAAAGKGTAIGDLAVASIDTALLIDRNFATVYEGSTSDLLQGSCRVAATFAAKDSAGGVLTAAKLLLQKSDKESTDVLRSTLGRSPVAAPVPATAITSTKGLGAEHKTAFSPYLTPFFPAFKALVKRRAKVVIRSPISLYPRQVLSLLFALFLGSLYFKPPFASWNIKASLASYITVLIAASSMVEARSTVHSALSMHQSLDGRLFYSFAVLASDWLVALPSSILSSLILALIPFYMVDYADDGGRPAFFLLIVFLVDQVFAIFTKTTVTALLNKDAARTLAGMYVMFFLFCGGFLLVPSLANPAYFSLYYGVNVFAWALRSFVLNEWLSPAYATPLPVFNASMAVVGTIAPGEFYSTVFELPGYSTMWKWAGIFIVAGYGLACLPMHNCALRSCRRRPKAASPKFKPSAAKKTASAGADAASLSATSAPLPQTAIEMTASADKQQDKASSAPAADNEAAVPPRGTLSFTVYAWPTHVTQPKDHEEHPTQLKAKKRSASTIVPASAGTAAAARTMEAYEVSVGPALEAPYHFDASAGAITIVGWERPLDIDTMLCDLSLLPAPSSPSSSQPKPPTVAWAASSSLEGKTVVTINPALDVLTPDSAQRTPVAVYTVPFNYSFFAEQTLLQSLVFSCHLRRPLQLPSAQHDKAVLAGTKTSHRPPAKLLAADLITLLGLSEYAGQKLMAIPQESWAYTAAAIAHELAAIGSPASAVDSVIVLDNILLQKGVSIHGVQMLAAAMDSVCKAYERKVSFLIVAPASRLETKHIYLPAIAALPHGNKAIALPSLLRFTPLSSPSSSPLSSRLSHTGHNALSPLDSGFTRVLGLLKAGYAGPSAPWIPHRSLPVVMALLFICELLRPLRNRSILIGRFIVTPLFLSLFVGVLFSTFEPGTFMGSGAQVSLVFVSSVFGGLASMGAGSQSLFQARHQMRREIGAKLYTPGQFVFTTALADALWTSIAGLIWALVAKGCASAITTTADGRLGSFYLYCWASLLAGNYLGFITGSVAPHFTGTMIAEQILTPLASLTAGLFIAPSAVPSYWKWLMAINPFSHLMNALLGSDLYCDAQGIPASSPDFPCPKVTLPVVLLEPTVVTGVPLPAGIYGRVAGVYQYLSGRYAFNYDERWSAYGVAIAIMVGCCVVATLLLRSVAEFYRRFEIARKLRHHYGVPAAMKAQAAAQRGAELEALGSPVEGECVMPAASASPSPAPGVTLPSPPAFSAPSHDAAAGLPSPVVAVDGGDVAE